MTAPSPQRREQLLALAESLCELLQSVQVPYLVKSSPPAKGVSPSTLGHAVSFLDRVRDRGQFEEFLRHFDQLDPLTAQNPANPKAEHRVLRAELEGFLTDHADLPARELLYVLAWTRRLLPRAHQENERPGGQPGRRGDPGPSRRSDSPARGRVHSPPPRSYSPPPPSPPVKAPPPGKSPGATLWKNVELQLRQGTPTIFKGNQTASCVKDQLSEGLLQKLKQGNLRVDARVVKRGGGKWRIEELTQLHQP